MMIGIDLGTTNSLVAVWENGAARLIPNGLGEVLTPSCVSLDEDGSILVGRAARERLQTHPHLSAAAFKRHMGSDKLITLGTRAFRPEELSALILRSLKEDAEAALGQTVSDCIITVPAYFSDAQRKATRNAGQLAGLRVDRLLNEPTAAALAYGVHLRDAETRFLVFDLGGGTFDVSVLDLFDNVMEVRASAGDNHLGGDDFTNLLVEYFFNTAKIPKDLQANSRFLQRAIADVERAKRSLSVDSKTTCSLVHDGVNYKMDLDESLLDKLCSPLVSRLREPADRALRDAGFLVNELDAIVLAGGATRMPIVRRMVARMFGRQPAAHINPDEVVALGAAVQAGLRCNDAALDEVMLTDVAPYSLGLETSVRIDENAYSPGHFDRLIERNCLVPVSRTKCYAPAREGQNELELNIYQGEGRMVSTNIKLGTLTVTLPQGPLDNQVVEVRFTYDVDGLLQVEVKLLSTGETTSMIIEGNPGVLSKDEIEQRFRALSELKIHPRERIENRTLLARAERLFLELLGAQRDGLGREIMAFEQTLAADDRRTYGPASRRFLEILDAIEHDSHLVQGADHE